jgi:excisionase family DNA binding protein
MKLITVTQAAAEYGLSDRWIRMLIKHGRIDATQYGKTWVMDAEAVARFMQRARPVGRPKKQVMS